MAGTKWNAISTTARTLAAIAVLESISFVALNQTYGESLPANTSTKTPSSTQAPLSAIEMRKRGCDYWEGQSGVAQNAAEAVHWFAKAAELGDAEAQAQMGKMYAWGLGGLPKNDVEAVRLYKLSADQRNAAGEYALGLMYEHGLGGLQKNEVEAVRLYKLSADQSNAYGENNLGTMYEHGLGGLQKNEVEAARLYRLSADQGNAAGESNLGTMYLHGTGGLQKGEVEAVRLYKLSADQGNATGENNLGLMYEQGLGGLQKNEVEAVRLYKLSADQGNAYGENNLGTMYEHGLGGLQKNEVEAVRLYRLSTDQGDASGENNLGTMYLHGIGGLQKDEVQAVRLYKLSADQGNAAGENNLGLMYEHGLGGLKKNEVEAARLYKLSADQNDSLGEVHLGTMYLQGLVLASVFFCILYLFPPGRPSTPTQLNQHGVGTAPTLHYAGVASRVWAHLLDMAILSVPIFFLEKWGVVRYAHFLMSVQLAMFVLYIVLCVWMVGRFGGSPAKLILRLRVIKLTGSSPTYIQALLRQAPYLLFWLINLVGLYVTLSVLGWSAVPSDYHVYMLQIRQHQSMWSHNAALLLGAFLIADFIVLSTNAKHRALHDLMAGTAVIWTRPS